jgi:acetolactate synthase-1/2/3 large subunit
MTTRTGGRILVDQLRIQGGDRIFTVPGESFLAALDAPHDTPEIDTIVCQHAPDRPAKGRLAPRN